MKGRVVRDFFDIFNSKRVNKLILRELKKYARTKRRKMRLIMFMDCQVFKVAMADMKKEYCHNEVYDGYFEIYSGVFIAEQFAPISVMEINIDRNKIKIEIFLLE